MSFLLVGDTAINLARVSWINLGGPGCWGVEVYLSGDPEPLRFVGAEAEAVRCYLSTHGCPVLTEEEQLV